MAVTLDDQTNMPFATAVRSTSKLSAGSSKKLETDIFDAQCPSEERKN
jgi:hypothetical protein